MNIKNKFRLRNEHNKIIGYEKWFVGVFNNNIKKDYYVIDPRWMVSEDNECWRPGHIEHRFKDQYIGLNDKNDKEIFEGDIVSCKIRRISRESVHSDHYYDYELIGEIVFHNGCFLIRDRVDGTLFLIPDDFVVFGNIYENPEFLERI